MNDSIENLKKTLKLAEPALSAVVPVMNEEENIPLVFKELTSAIEGEGLSYEIIFVDDGSTDDSFKEMMKLKEVSPAVKIVRFRSNKGKTAALSAGFRAARGELVVTIDADLQESPQEIGKMIKEMEKGFDLVSAWRYNRQDSPTKNLVSKVFNRFVRMITGDTIHDINCGFKLYKKEVVKNLNLYGELHRVIPTLASASGFRVGEVQVEHQPRKFGHTKFSGFLRGFHGIFDLFSVLFLSRFGNRPLHFFGMAGFIVFAFGFAIALFLALRYFLGFGFIGERMPLFLLGILSMVLGFQSLSIGLVGEMLVKKILTPSNKYDEEFYS